jgi:hypothetical protein
MFKELEVYHCYLRFYTYESTVEIEKIVYVFNLTTDTIEIWLYEESPILINPKWILTLREFNSKLEDLKTIESNPKRVSMLKQINSKYDI